MVGCIGLDRENLKDVPEYIPLVQDEFKEVILLTEGQEIKIYSRN